MTTEKPTEVTVTIEEPSATRTTWFFGAVDAHEIKDGVLTATLRHENGSTATVAISGGLLDRLETDLRATAASTGVVTLFGRRG